MTESKNSGTIEGQEEKSFFKVIVHSFFIIPFLIAVFCLLLFTAFKLLTQERRTVYEYLNDVKVGSLTKRWQSAFELSKILANPAVTPKEERFSTELINAFEQSKHDDDRVRQYLALAMGRTEDPVYLKPLLEGLKEEKENNLTALIYALGMLKQGQAAGVLYQYLDNPNARIRSITVVALGNIADPGSKLHLKRSLNDPEANVQWGAAISLARMNDASGKNVLLKILNRGYWKDFPEVDAEEQNNIMLMGVQAVGNLNDKDLFERIKELSLSDQSMRIRSAALKILNIAAP